MLSLALVLLILVVIIIVPHRPRPLSSSCILVPRPRFLLIVVSSLLSLCLWSIVLIPHTPLLCYPHPSSSSSFSSSSPSLFIVLVLVPVPNLVVAIVAVVAVFVIVVVASCLHSMDGQGWHGQKGSKNASQAASIGPSVHHAVFSDVWCGTPTASRGQFLEGAREGGDESPFKKCPLTSQKPRRSQSAASHDGNISSVDCCVARKISTRGSRRQKLGGASYDTFSVQYQKNNFYLAGARKHM